jgi:RNAse (barnase) inhibitor barstar
MNDGKLDSRLAHPSRISIHLVSTGKLQALTTAAYKAHLLVRRIDLSNCNDKASLLLRLSNALDFPPGWGRNWDALADALRDLSWWHPANGYVLLFETAGQFRTASPQDFDILIDVMQDAAQFWADNQVPFWAFLAVS